MLRMWKWIIQLYPELWLWHVERIVIFMQISWHVPRKWKIVRQVRWNCSRTTAVWATHRMWFPRKLPDFCIAMSVARLKCALELIRPVWLQDRICRVKKIVIIIWIVCIGNRWNMIAINSIKWTNRNSMAYLESPFGWHACNIAGRASSSSTSTVRTPAFRTVTSIVK